MATRLLSIALPCFMLVAACSSSGSSPAQGSDGPDAASPADDAGSDDGSTSLLAPPPAGQGMQITMSTTIAAGTEDEKCKFIQIADDMWVNHEDIRYTPGSHHFLVYQTPYTSIPTVNNDGKTVDTTQVFDCLGGPNVEWNVDQFVGGAQGADAPPALNGLPPNVALHIPAGSVLMLDLHVLNPSTQALTPVVAMNFDTIPKSQVTEEAGGYFFYNPFIRIPPNSSSHARMSCPVTSNVTLTTMQTHMHKWGLGGVVNLEDGSGNLVQQLYSSSVWTDPPVTVWAPTGMTLTAGQQIDYECNYENTGDTDVIQGFSALTNEMCVVAGAYYPRDTKFENCSTDGNWNDSGNAATYIGSGTTTCADSLTCLENAQTDDAFFGCMVDSCPGAAAALTSVVDCFMSAGSSASTACVTQGAQCIETSCN
jgi:hypothetical protein